MENITKQVKVKHKKTVIAYLNSSIPDNGNSETTDSHLDTLLTTSVVTITHNR
jgi:hypothetical protein